MPVPILSDGTPLTFEWLNSVANAINALEVDNKNNSNILVSGYVKDVDVQVVTGKIDISISANKKGIQVRRENIKFPVSFKDSEVVVVAMVTHSVTGSTKPNPAAVSVDGITATKFNATVQVFDADNDIKNEKFEVKYIAIGKRAIV
jgi:ribosomal protein S24E